MFEPALATKVIAVLTGHCHANYVLFATTSDAASNEKHLKTPHELSQPGVAFGDAPSVDFEDLA
ncbi:hypothetical protein DY000_02027193 [Brassica cretica]|uniref:Uncharacterized protein n=1 Tax=Brassica cretica TaxID=69181 RepID=A0ABQ7EM11_BRACR|nr:hypothetical protein DY000_02027193 [Brassica cretica]